jgi:recombinational DNA repair ATPase RecF
VTNAITFVKAVHFKNFRVLRKATLPLDRFTLLIGPNGSGKSTAMLGLEAADDDSFSFQRLASVSARNDRRADVVEVSVEWSDVPWLTKVTWTREGGHRVEPSGREGQRIPTVELGEWSKRLQVLNGFRIFSLDAHALADSIPACSLGRAGRI